MGIYKKVYTLGVVALALSVLSCPLIDPLAQDDDDTLGTRTFWAQSFDGSFYELTADIAAIGQHCTIWIERTEKARVADIEAIKNTFDNNIYPKMRDNFAIENITFSGRSFPSTLELADTLGDGDGKLAILLLDIRDGYSGSGDVYTAGTFWKGNYYREASMPSGYHSNQMDMIYVDTYPGIPNSDASYGTLAHEMQHMLNFVASQVKRVSSNILYPLDLWIDEGLSSAAEYIYLGGHSQKRIDWFNGEFSDGGPIINYPNTIAQGNNFFVWGNDTTDDMSILDEYATVYLFFQWLRLHGGPNIYKKILASPYPYTDHRAVTNAADETMPGNGYDDWPTLLKTWMAANYIKAPSGKYGYKGEINTKAKAALGAGSISLLPGEGVYSGTTSAGPVPTASEPINYAALHKSPATVDSTTSNGGALLTYNSNTNWRTGSAGTGTITGTGIAASVSMAPAQPASRSAGAGSFPGPYHIDARDMMARNGHGPDFTLPLSLEIPVDIEETGDE
jgi:hypothetical protein